ncbi:hypothetical protein QQP08_012567 [Theobroma cacao]|nr:hypothetical protein QQP08_012567 [Theobroma cacao]
MLLEGCKFPLIEAPNKDVNLGVIVTSLGKAQVVMPQTKRNVFNGRETMKDMLRPMFIGDFFAKDRAWSGLTKFKS